MASSDFRTLSILPFRTPVRSAYMHASASVLVFVCTSTRTANDIGSDWIQASIVEIRYLAYAILVVRSSIRL